VLQDSNAIYIVLPKECIISDCQNVTSTIINHKNMKGLLVVIEETSLGRMVA
jgi:hypothetical protein